MPDWWSWWFLLPVLGVLAALVLWRGLKNAPDFPEEGGPDS